MLRTLFSTLAVFLACSVLWAANYDVNISGVANLGEVPQANVSPPPVEPQFDATLVAAGDALYVVAATDSANVNAARLTVQGGGTLHLGYDTSDDATVGYINLSLINSDNVRQDFTIGSNGTAGTVNLGHADLDTSVVVTGGKLNVVNGVVNYDTGTSGRVTVNFETLELAKGAINMDGPDSVLSVSRTSVIGNGVDTTTTATLNASSGLTFTGNTEIKRGGLLQGTGASTDVKFGANAILTLSGGSVAANGSALKLNARRITIEDVEDAVSTIDATGGSVAFADDAALTVHGNLGIVNANSAITLTSYTQDGGDVVISGTGGLTVANKGEITAGSFQATHSTFSGGLDLSEGARLLHGALSLGTDTLLRIGRTAFMDLSDGNLVVKGGDVEVYGTLVVGANNGQAWRLDVQDSGATVTFMSTASIELSEDFIDKLDGSNYLGTVIVDVGANGAIVLPGDKSELEFDNFLYGQYTYALNDSGDLALKSYFTGIDRDGTQADYEWAKALLFEKYGKIVAETDGFALNIYKSAVREDAAGVVPFDRLKASADALIEGSNAEKSYLMNLANLQAFAKGSDLALDGSLAGMYSGLNNSGVVDVAMNTAGAVVDHVKMRLRDLNTARLDTGETICPSEALPAFVLDSDHANRIWFGGFGMLENARTREGMSGYRYEPAGFVGGYDYAIDKFGFGLVYAYAKGDFADKTSLRHDSKVSSHSFGVHGTYFDPSGFYISGMGGYTYSSNDISELRSDASVTAGSSWNRADYNGHTLHGALEMGYEIRVRNGFTVTPTLGVTYIYSEATDHDEMLGNVLAGRIRGVKHSATYVPVRVEAAYEFCTGAESRLKLTANAGYAYRFDGDDIEGTFDIFGFSNAFSHRVVGREAGHHSYNLGTGLRFYTDRFDIGIKYDFYGMADYSAHRLMATAGFSF